MDASEPPRLARLWQNRQGRLRFCEVCEQAGGNPEAWWLQQVAARAALELKLGTQVGLQRRDFSNRRGSASSLILLLVATAHTASCCLPGERRVSQRHVSAHHRRASGSSRSRENALELSRRCGRACRRRRKQRGRCATTGRCACRRALLHASPHNICVFFHTFFTCTHGHAATPPGGLQPSWDYIGIDRRPMTIASCHSEPCRP